MDLLDVAFPAHERLNPPMPRRIGPDGVTCEIGTIADAGGAVPDMATAPAETGYSALAGTKIWSNVPNSRRTCSEEHE